MIVRRTARSSYVASFWRVIALTLPRESAA